MTTTRFAILIGLLLGLVWALAPFRHVVFAVLFAVAGYLLALVVEGRINVDGQTLGIRRESRERR